MAILNLPADLVQLGFNVGSSSELPTTPQLPEKLLVQIARESLARGYDRNLGLLFSWIEQCRSVLHIAELVKQIRRSKPAATELALWSAVGQWQSSDSRFRLLAGMYKGPRVVLDDTALTRMQIDRFGEDPRFAGTHIVLSARALPSRPDKDLRPLAWILTHNAIVANRVRFGPNYRADVWTMLSGNAELTLKAIRELTGCSEGTASTVRADFRLLHGLTA